MLVVAPVTADATSAVALLAAYPTAVWRTRGQLAGVLDRKSFWLLLIPSVLGRLLGALLLSRTGDRNFVQVVPWLVVVATFIILLRPILVRQIEDESKQLDFAAEWWPVVTSYEETIHSFLHGTDRSCSYLPWSSKPIEGR
jgi:uncharacterized membrane protein YfcA